MQSSPCAAIVVRTLGALALFALTAAPVRAQQCLGVPGSSVHVLAGRERANGSSLHTVEGGLAAGPYGVVGDYTWGSPGAEGSEASAFSGRLYQQVRTEFFAGCWFAGYSHSRFYLVNPEGNNEDIRTKENSLVGQAAVSFSFSAVSGTTMTVFGAYSLLSEGRQRAVFGPGGRVTFESNSFPHIWSYGVSLALGPAFLRAKWDDRADRDGVTTLGVGVGL